MWVQWRLRRRERVGAPTRHPGSSRPLGTQVAIITLWVWLFRLNTYVLKFVCHWDTLLSLFLLFSLDKQYLYRDISCTLLYTVQLLRLYNLSVRSVGSTPSNPNCKHTWIILYYFFFLFKWSFHLNYIFRSFKCAKI